MFECECWNHTHQTLNKRKKNLKSFVVKILTNSCPFPVLSTDVYLYAVDPKSNSVIDMGLLQE